MRRRCSRGSRENHRGKHGGPQSVDPQSWYRFSIAVEKCPGSDGARVLVALRCWGHAMPDRVTTMTPQLLLASGNLQMSQAISAMTLCVKCQECMGEA